jgi:hypothetical protein
MPAANRLLIQVVPQLRPEACGVSDHAISLAQELEAGFGICTAFVVLNSTQPCDSPFPRVYCKPSQLVDACVSISKGQPSALLVHYSGYGYSADGAPFILAEAIQRVRGNGQFRIGVYFHELSATGMPWTSAFWYTHRQKQVARRIARECDLIVTNLRRHEDLLAGNPIHDIVNPIHRMPVFSNVRESVEIAPMRVRRSAMAVFGLASTRQKSYKRLSPLKETLHSLGIEEILDIGSECNAPSSLNGIPVRRIGVLTADDLGSLLSQSMYGFVPHPSFVLAKSGIFAGLCAHGAVPVLAESFRQEVDGLRDGVHLLSPRTVKAALAMGLEHCSTAAWNWYCGHRLNVHAATYSRFLIQPPSEAEAEMCASGKAAGV